MREFFKGWRRKAGVVTLVTACVVAAGWVQSLSRENEIAWIVWRRVHSVVSEPGWISWWAWNDASHTTWPKKVLDWNTRLIGISRPDNRDEFLAELKKRPENANGISVFSYIRTGPWSIRRRLPRVQELYEDKIRDPSSIAS